MWSTSRTKVSCHDQLDLVWFVMKIRQDNGMIDCIGLSMLKSKLNCLELFDQVQFVMKTRQDNDVTDWTSAPYTVNDTEL